MATERHPAVSLIVERIFSIMTVLGLTCLGVGLALFITGNAADVFTAAQIGAIVLLVGVLLVVVRALFWLVEVVVERGLATGLDTGS